MWGSWDLNPDRRSSRICICCTQDPTHESGVRSASGNFIKWNGWRPQHSPALSQTMCPHSLLYPPCHLAQASQSPLEDLPNTVWALQPVQENGKRPGLWHKAGLTRAQLGTCELVSRREWGGRDNTWCHRQLGLILNQWPWHLLDFCKTVPPPQQEAWSICQLIFHVSMRNQDMAIYGLWICLLRENWINVMASQEQNLGDATCSLTQTTSATGHMTPQALMATCECGEIGSESQM